MDMIEAAHAAEREAVALQVSTLRGELGTVVADRDLLQRERSELREQLRVANAQILTLQHHIATVGQMLLDEADRRDWCNDYDRFARDVNNACGAPVLLMRSRDHRVTISLEMMVNARDEDSAGEMADEMMHRLEGRSDYGMTWDIGTVEEAAE